MITVSDKIKVSSLPTVLCERYLNATGLNLKVALFLLINGSCEASDIAQALSVSQDKVDSAVSYWTDCGLFEDSSSVELKGSDKDDEIREAARGLTKDEIAERTLIDKNLCTLFQESQRILGRTLSLADDKNLIEVLDVSGLPIEVLIMALSYSQETNPGKSVLRAFNYLASDWSKEGINTLDLAEKQIDLMNIRAKRYEVIAKLINTEVSEFSRKNKAAIDSWYEEFNYNEAFVSEVITRKPDAGIGYITKTLQNWYSKGYTTISQIRTASASNAQPAATRNYEESSLIDKFYRDIDKED